MIKKILENIKIFVKRFKLLFLVMKPFISIVKIILDKRYLYHYLQGLITNVKTRSNLAKIEANLFKSEKRSSDKKPFISLDKSEHSSLIKENIKLFKGKVKNIDQLNTSLS